MAAQLAAGFSCFTRERLMHNRKGSADVNDNPLETAATRKDRSAALLQLLGFLGIANHSMGLLLPPNTNAQGKIPHSRIIL